MIEIKIMSIQELLHLHALKDSIDCMIVFVTTKPNYYNFGYTRFYHLNIADTDAPVIKKVDARKIQDMCNSAGYDTIYVCCDAGLSRSPAVALFLAQRLGEHHQAQLINDKYRFINLHLYKRLVEMVK